MKVKLLSKKPRVVEVNASYGARLIEQGKAVLTAQNPTTEKKAVKNS